MFTGIISQATQDSSNMFRANAERHSSMVPYYNINTTQWGDTLGAGKRSGIGAGFNTSMDVAGYNQKYNRAGKWALGASWALRATPSGLEGLKNKKTQNTSTTISQYKQGLDDWKHYYSGTGYGNYAVPADQSQFPESGFDSSQFGYGFTEEIPSGGFEQYGSHGDFNPSDYGFNGARSGIYIKPSKRGSFTKYCGGKVTEECIRKGKNSPNAAIRKKATFAANARKWKKGEDGLFVEGEEAPYKKRDKYTKLPPSIPDKRKQLRDRYRWTAENSLSMANNFMRFRGLPLIIGVADKAGAILGDAPIPGVSPLSMLGVPLQFRGDNSPQQDEYIKKRSAEQMEKYKALQFEEPMGPDSDDPLYYYRRPNKMMKRKSYRHGGFIPAKCGIKVSSRKKKKAVGGIVAVNPIHGPSHEAGGVNMVINGQPIEAEGGEYKIDFNDGSKAIFNKGQMHRLRLGESPERIIQSMPKVNPRAEDGLIIDDYPKQWKEGLMPSPLWSYFGNHANEKNDIPMTDFDYQQFGRNENYDNLLHQEYIQRRTGGPFFDQSRNYAVSDTYFAPSPSSKRILDKSIPEKYQKYIADRTGMVPYKARNYTQKTPFDDEPIPRRERRNKTQNMDIFDRYNRSLNWGTAIGAASALGQGLMAYYDMKRNERMRGPDYVAGITAPRITPFLLNNEDVKRDVDRSFVSGINMSRQLGRPEYIPALIANRDAAIERSASEIGKVNAATSVDVSAKNAEMLLNAEKINRDILGSNIDRSLNFDAYRTQLIGSNRAMINDSLAYTAGLYSDRSTRRLTSDVIRMAVDYQRKHGGSFENAYAMVQALMQT